MVILGELALTVLACPPALPRTPSRSLILVILQDSMLFYYKPDVVLPDDSGVIPGSTAAGYINLASQCKVSQPSKNRICLQAELRNYFFICDSTEEAAAWEADISKNLQLVKKKEHVR